MTVLTGWRAGFSRMYYEAARSQCGEHLIRERVRKPEVLSDVIDAVGRGAFRSRCGRIGGTTRLSW
jgi:hypothetical protein